MAAPIINEEFHVGERYQGQINHESLTVQDIIRKGDIQHGQYGGQWRARSDEIRFLCEETQRTYIVGLEMAKRLQLTKVGAPA